MCYNTYRKKEIKQSEVNVMMYLIETRIGYEVLPTYEDAEMRCWELGIHPEEIVEITDEEAAETCG
jgi:hypothetical protein